MICLAFLIVLYPSPSPKISTKIHLFSSLQLPDSTAYQAQKSVQFLWAAFAIGGTFRSEVLAIPKATYLSRKTLAKPLGFPGHSVYRSNRGRQTVGIIPVRLSTLVETVLRFIQFERLPQSKSSAVPDDRSTWQILQQPPA